MYSPIGCPLTRAILRMTLRLPNATRAHSVISTLLLALDAMVRNVSLRNPANKKAATEAAATGAAEGLFNAAWCRASLRRKFRPAL